MSAEPWIHYVELVLLVLVLPTLKWAGAIGIGLRDATRDLVTATHAMSKTLADHESRIRELEKLEGYGGPERRHREVRAI